MIEKSWNISWTKTFLTAWCMLICDTYCSNLNVSSRKHYWNLNSKLQFGDNIKADNGRKKWGVHLDNGYVMFKLQLWWFISFENSSRKQKHHKTIQTDNGIKNWGGYVTSISVNNFNFDEFILKYFRAHKHDRQYRQAMAEKYRQTMA